MLAKDELSKHSGNIPLLIEQLHSEMLLAAEQLDFEKAARLRDQIAELRGQAPKSTPRKGGRKR